MKSVAILCPEEQELLQAIDLCVRTVADRVNGQAENMHCQLLEKKEVKRFGGIFHQNWRRVRKLGTVQTLMFPMEVSMRNFDLRCGTCERY
jgi:hypothetical protein